MREIRSLGSVRGAARKGRPYRNPSTSLPPSMHPRRLHRTRRLTHPRLRSPAVWPRAHFAHCSCAGRAALERERGDPTAMPPIAGDPPQTRGFQAGVRQYDDAERLGGDADAFSRLQAFLDRANTRGIDEQLAP